MSERIAKINALIQEEISDIILKNLSLKGGVFITVTKVDTTRDLRYTRVFVSIFPEKEMEYALKTINKEIYTLQKLLNKRLKMKPLPRLEFRNDLTEAKAEEVERILREI